MRRTIIVPVTDPHTDAHRVSELAIPWARALAAERESLVVLVSVFEAVTTQQLSHLDDWNVAAGRGICEAPDPRDERQHYLHQLAACFPGVEVQTVVRDGDPVAEILALASSFPEPTIVMASHSRTGVQRLILGSITLRVVRAAPCPVLVMPVPADGMLVRAPATIERVLVPLDDTFVADAVLDAVVNALGAENAGRRDLHLIEVTEPIPPRPDVVAHDHYEWTPEPAPHFLHGVAERARRRGLRVTWELRIGEPSDEIARAAEEHEIDLIAMATQGRTGFNRLILGSLTEHDVHHRAVPFLLIRPETDVLASAARAARIVRETHV